MVDVSLGNSGGTEGVELFVFDYSEESSLAEITYFGTGAAFTVFGTGSTFSVSRLGEEAGFAEFLGSELGLGGFDLLFDFLFFEFDFLFFFEFLFLLF